MSHAALNIINDYSTINSGIDARANNKNIYRAHDYPLSTLPNRSGVSDRFETIHPLWAALINDNEYIFNKPIALRVQRQGDHFFAENEFLDICGYGDTVEEALSDAVNDIVYYFNYYSSLNESELVGFGLELKDRYLHLFNK